jgi:hypothetical protein
MYALALFIDEIHDKGYFVADDQDITINKSEAMHFETSELAHWAVKIVNSTWEFSPCEIFRVVQIA